MRSQWKQIIQEAEKQLLAAEIEYLRRAQQVEERKARDALVRLQEILGRDPQAYNDAEAAIATVTSRVKANESHKLRTRWVHDIHRNEAAKVGLSIPTKTKGNKAKPNRPTKNDSPSTRVIKQGKRRLQSNSTAQGLQTTPRAGTSRQTEPNDNDLLKTLLTGLVNKL